MRKLLCLCVVFVGLALVHPVRAADPTKGKVLFEEWYSSPTNDINGDLETLKNNARYPNNPDTAYWSTIGMDRPDGGEDYWGCRGRAYLAPPRRATTRSGPPATMTASSGSAPTRTPPMRS